MKSGWQETWAVKMITGSFKAQHNRRFENVIVAAPRQKGNRKHHWYKRKNTLPLKAKQGNYINHQKNRWKLTLSRHKAQAFPHGQKKWNWDCFHRKTLRDANCTCSNSLVAARSCRPCRNSCECMRCISVCVCMDTEMITHLNLQYRSICKNSDSV